MSNDPFFIELLRLFYREDPMHLVPSGAPEDEYMPEVYALVPSLQTTPPSSPQELRSMIHRIVALYFAPMDVGSEERFEALADAVWGAWQRTQQAGAS